MGVGGAQSRAIEEKIGAVVTSPPSYARCSASTSSVEVVFSLGSKEVIVIVCGRVDGF